MTENPVPSTDTAASPRSWHRTVPVAAAVLIIAVALLYMERIPAFLHWPMRILFVAAVAGLAYAVFRKIRATKFVAKKIVFSLILIGFLYGALFLVCHVFIKLMAARDERLAAAKTTELGEKSRHAIEKMLKGKHPGLFDPDVGWVPRPDYQWKIHTIGAQGLRGTRVYPESPEDPEKRILCIGDSFTFGYEVEDDQTYPYHGEQLLPGTEWINMGICGTGLTQSLMHYRKNGRKYGGNYVVIGFMTNNAKRTVNCFRPFVSPDDITPFTQPFAKLSGGTVSIEPNPYQDISDYEKLLANEREELERLYELDYFTWSNQRATTNPVLRTIRYVSERRSIDRNLAILCNRPIDNAFGKFRAGADPYGPSIWHPESPGFQTNVQVFDLYYNEVIADGRVPLIVILPSGGDVEDRSAGRPTKHAALLAHLEEKGYRYFDFLDSLEAIYRDKLSPEALYGGTHFNGETNKLLAEEIIKALSLQ